MYGHENICKLLLNKGANINVTNLSNGETPLHVALKHNGHRSDIYRQEQRRIVTLLIDRGADLQIKAAGYTPLDYVVNFYSENTSIMEILKKAIKEQKGGSLMKISLLKLFILQHTSIRHEHEMSVRFRLMLLILRVFSLKYLFIWRQSSIRNII